MKYEEKTETAVDANQPESGAMPSAHSTAEKRPEKKPKKQRLDLLLFSRGLAPSREKAKTLIMSGIVYVNGQKEDKAGTAFLDVPETQIEVRGHALPYVSRGGLKLEKAVKTFGLSFPDYVCMDIGASTGGFTDCMLQNGAAKVFAVDVGHGQLDWKLREDPRVVCMEKTNIRYVTPADIGGEALDFASVDVSLISLDKVLPAAYPLLKDGGHMVCLIKPQFEAGREQVGKKGVVRDKNVHEAVIQKILCLSEETGFEILGLTYSPIRGPEGNIEYLIYLQKRKKAAQAGESGVSEETTPVFEKFAAETPALVEAAHAALSD